jgi:hypothetical protein
MNTSTTLLAAGLLAASALTTTTTTAAAAQPTSRLSEQAGPLQCSAAPAGDTFDLEAYLEARKAALSLQRAQRP